jgi:uncharacterized protein YbjT (DUF2867 family)
VQNFWEKGVCFEGEVRQGKALADAAKAEGITHFVQASIAGCEQAPEVLHFKSKAIIEDHIRSLGLPATMLRTVFFMDNWLDPKMGNAIFPFLAGGLRGDLRFHMVATDDIGAVAAKVFAQRDRYIGKNIDIAGDLLMVAEMKETFRQVTGRTAPWFRIPGFLVSLLNAEMAHQFAWNKADGWTFSLDEVRAIHPGIMTYEAFAKRHLR